MCTLDSFTLEQIYIGLYAKYASFFQRDEVTTTLETLTPAPPPPQTVLSPPSMILEHIFRFRSLEGFGFYRVVEPLMKRCQSFICTYVGDQIRVSCCAHCSAFKQSVVFDRFFYWSNFFKKRICVEICIDFLTKIIIHQSRQS